MHRTMGSTLSLLLFGLVGSLVASDYTGVYAVIDKVTLKGVDTGDATIQLEGVFALAKGRRQYHEPHHGYLYFRLDQGKADVCRKEWADLKRVAGTGQFVAFGHRFGPRGQNRRPGNVGRVRSLNEKLAKPDVYPLNFGIRKIRQSPGYPATESLAYYATPVTPAEGAKVEAGKVKLAASKVRAKDAKVKYKFEIELRSGKKFLSEPIAAGDKVVEWTPDLEIQAGQPYTWRVWAVTKESRGKRPVATAHFVGKAAE